MAFDKLVPCLAAEAPHDRFLHGDDRRRAPLPRQKGHFAEPVLRPEHGDVFSSPSGALKHDLDCARLNEIEGVALITLGKNSCPGGKSFFLELPENLRDVLA